MLYVHFVIKILKYAITLSTIFWWDLCCSVLIFFMLFWALIFVCVSVTFFLTMKLSVYLRLHSLNILLVFFAVDTAPKGHKGFTDESTLTNVFK